MSHTNSNSLPSPSAPKKHFSFFLSLIHKTMHWSLWLPCSSIFLGYLIAYYPMATHSKNGIFRPKKLHVVSEFALPPVIEPSYESQTIKISKWKKEMSDELNALLAKYTWSLVPPKDNYNGIGCKWVFWIKRHIDGFTARYKARLVAKGFHQQPNVDYLETLSPIIKPQTIKLVFCISHYKGWSLSYMDVNNAFLHGTIQEKHWYDPTIWLCVSCPAYICLQIEQSSIWSQASSLSLVPWTQIFPSRV